MQKELIYMGVEKEDFMIDGVNPFEGAENEVKVRWVRSIKVRDPIYYKKHDGDMYEIRATGTRFILVEVSFCYYVIYKIVQQNKKAKKEKRKEYFYMGVPRDELLIDGVNPFRGAEDESKVRFVRPISVRDPSFYRRYRGNLYEIKATGTRFTLSEVSPGFYMIYKIAAKHKFGKNTKER